MSFGSTTVEDFVGSELLEKANSDFLGEIDDTQNWGDKPISEIFTKYGAGLHTLKDFYNGKIDSKIYVKNFLELILNLSKNEYSEKREDKQMREYQLKLILDTLNFIQNSKHNAGYIHSATSTGKTVIFAEIARQVYEVFTTGKILIVVSGKEAQARARKEFDELGIPTGLYNKDKKADKRVTIITRQSLIRTGKDNIDPESISLMICDEIHDGFLGPKSKETLSRFPCKKIGYTATPELRNKHVEEVFGKKIGEYLIDEAQRDGHLPAINSDHTIELDDEFWEDLVVQGDDYTGESLGKLKIDDVFPKVLDFFKDGPGKGKQFALFMPSVASSIRLQEYLEDNGIKVGHLDGTSKDVENIKDQFENKEIQIITSCEKMTQSWDSDIIDGVMNLRPTLSPSKYFQILGRALHGKQIIDGNKIPKDEVMMVDIVNSKESFRNRTISASAVKEVLKGKKGTHNRERIEKISPRIVRELQMYYDFDIEINKDSIGKIVDEFRKKLSISKSVFYNNIEDDPTFYDTETEELINITFISNSALGKSYSGRKREVGVSLGVFLQLTQNIFDIQESEEKYNFNQGMDYYRGVFMDPSCFTTKGLKVILRDNIPRYAHLIHMYNNLFSDEDRKKVGISRLDKTHLKRNILGRIRVHFRKQYSYGGFSNNVNTTAIHYCHEAGIVYGWGKVDLKHASVKNMSSYGLSLVRGESKKTTTSLRSILDELPLEILESIDIDFRESSFSEEQKKNLFIEYLKYVGFQIVNPEFNDVTEREYDFTAKNLKYYQKRDTPRTQAPIPFNSRTLNFVIDGIPLFAHLEHVYKNILTEEDRKNIGELEIKGAKVNKIFLARFDHYFLKKYLGEETKNKIGVNTESYICSTSKIRYRDGKVILYNTNVAGIRSSGIKIPKKQTEESKLKYINMRIPKMIGELPIEVLISCGIDFKNKKFTDQEMMIITKEYLKYLGFEVIDPYENESPEKQILLQSLDLKAIIYNIFESDSQFLKDTNICIEAKEDGSVIIDASYINLPEKINLKVQQYPDGIKVFGEGKPLSISSELFLKHLYHLVVTSSSREKTRYLKQIKIDTSHDFHYTRTKVNSKENAGFISILYRLIDDINSSIDIIGDTENMKAQHQIREALNHKNISGISGEAGVNIGAYKEIIRGDFDEESGEFTYNSQEFTNMKMQLFLTTFITGDLEITSHLPLHLKEDIYLALEGKHDSIIELFEEIFDFAGIPLRDTSE